MITHKEYMPSREELILELSFMYAQYEEVCRAYKRLAEKHKEDNSVVTVHDMSHMTFIEEGEM